jgi:hypothetical protein
MENRIRYPKKIIKYFGGIYERNGKWRVIIDMNGHYLNKTVETKKEAKKLLKEKNLEFEFPVRNIIHDFGDYLEVELTKEKRTKFDRDDLPIIESYCWFTHEDKNKPDFFHVVAKSNGKTIQLHNLIMNHTPGKLTVDHRNRDGLDNRKENLRIVSKRTQTLNRGILKTNKSGTTGVYKRNCRGSEYYVAQWRIETGQEKSKYFSIKEHGEDEAKRLAILHRKTMEQTLEHYAEALDI